MAGNVGKPGGRAIAAAFAGQAGIVAAIGALLGAGSPAATAPPPVTAIAAPALFPVSPVPSPPANIPFTLTVNGQHGSGVFTGVYGEDPVLAFTVAQGETLTVTFQLAIPYGQSVSDLQLNLAGNGVQGADARLYDDTAQPLAAGTHTFTFTFAPAVAVQPGAARWTATATMNTLGGYETSRIGVINVER